MQNTEYMRYIVDEIHSTVFATVDGEGRPVTCAIDIMDWDETGLYFLTAKGKNFYDRLKANENIAFTAMKGEDTLSCVGGVGAGQGERDRAGENSRPVPQKSVYGEDLSRCALPQRPHRIQNLRGDGRMV